jgi:RNA polymerase sigma factor (sigma-70 family)
MVQETLLALQSALPQSATAFLAYAMQTLKRKQIDLNRGGTAEKRGGGNVLSLEGLSGQAKEGDGRSWDEKLQEYAISASSANWRTIERAVSDQEVRCQLRQFGLEHLPTELQRQVFEAHFLDGLTPAEIAGLLGKQPHEIRLIKARVVKKIKELSPTAMQQLLEIIGGLAPDE